MESGSEDASSAVQATSLEAGGAKDVQNGDAAAVVEPEPSKNGKNESEGEFNKKLCSCNYVPLSMDIVTRISNIQNR